MILVDVLDRLLALLILTGMVMVPRPVDG